MTQLRYTYFRNIEKSAYWLFIVLLILLLPSCATREEPYSEEKAAMDLDLVQRFTNEPISYEESVRPILRNRCVVCHGCYDAPCQLKLSSPAGITRGASDVKVYNGARFKTAQPTRLGIDGFNAKDWRAKKFHAVLSEDNNDAAQNLKQSVLYQMLRMKQLSPQPGSPLRTCGWA